MPFHRNLIVLVILFLAAGCATDAGNSKEAQTHTLLPQPLPPLDTQLSAMKAEQLASSTEGAAFIDVRFEDLILLVTQGTTRAVLVRDTEHTPELVFTKGADLGEVNTAFGTNCQRLPCTVTLPFRIGMRIVHSNDLPSVNGLDTTTEPAFNATVPKLGAFATALDSDVLASFPPANGDVAAFMDFRGRIVDSKPHSCLARFKFADGSTGGWQYLNHHSTARHIFNHRPVLEVNKGSGTPSRIALSGDAELVLRNRPKHPGLHFHLLKELLTGVTNFPVDVELHPDCQRPLSDVPGCGNTQFP